MSSATASLSRPVRGLEARAVWRWHFYASFFCIPFVLWLSATGTIYLFKPQIERFLDRPYDHLAIAHRATANAQAQAALAAVPGGTLDSYELPHTPASAAQVLVDRGAQQFRVYVHPETLAILKVDDEDRRLERIVFKLHGELLIGETGSWMVELAGSWAVIMILTGLFLWWPRSAPGLGGVLYPRLRSGSRTFWRDLHSVTGIYVSCLALFQLFTGLPWAKGWGGYLKTIRHYSAGQAVAQDWTTSSSEAIAARISRTQVATTASEHAQHNAPPGNHRGSSLMGPSAFSALDSMIAAVVPLNLPEPVLISPPSSAGGNWTAKSDTPDRPRRVNLVLDGGTGAILSRADFNTRPWLDRIIGTGVAAHEGALFGLANQLVSLLMVAGLVTLSLSGLIMWWRRKPEGALGAPAPIGRVRFSPALVALLFVLGVYFPFFGGSMILVGLTEKFILRRIPQTQRWLGLSAAPAQT